MSAAEPGDERPGVGKRQATREDIGGANASKMRKTDVEEKAEATVKSEKYYSDPNFPMVDGRVLHLGLRRGELANRVVHVGSLTRAKLLASTMDEPEKTFELKSERLMLTYTGLMDGVPISVIGTGMGFPMTDFAVREGRAVCDGPMLLFRFGSCGGLQERAVPGTVVVGSKGCVNLQRNPDAFRRPEVNSSECYTVSQVVLPDAMLSQHVQRHLQSALGQLVVDGVNVSADTFYASQGRIDANFSDFNHDLIGRLHAECPEAVCMEMESFHLLDVATCSRGSVRAGCAAIVLANRLSGNVISEEDYHRLELEGGRAVLKALASFPMDESCLMTGNQCVWNQRA